MRVLKQINIELQNRSGLPRTKHRTAMGVEKAIRINDAAKIARSQVRPPSRRYQ
jgi:hypothetical protein